MHGEIPVGLTFDNMPLVPWSSGAGLLPPQSAAQLEDGITLVVAGPGSCDTGRTKQEDVPESLGKLAGG